jgi:hypothetical protein
LQAFGALSLKGLQSQIPSCPENRLAFKGLGDFSRSTKYPERRDALRAKWRRSLVWEHPKDV